MLRTGSMAAAASFVPAALGMIPALAPAPVPAVAAGPVTSPATVRVSTASVKVAADVHYGRPQNASGYSVIVVTGKHSGWAFGGTNPGGPSTPVAARWDGTRVTPSALPAGLTGFISEASAVSSHDIWAASQYGRYVLHWNGTRWSLVRQWHGMITGLTAVSTHDAWVFGTTDTGTRENGTWHYDGRSWQRVSGPADQIYRASAVSRHDIWAIAAGTKSDVILRYNGSTWRQVQSGDALLRMQAHDILAVSARDVWVAGNEVSQSGTGRLILAHWNGVTWLRLATKLEAWAGRLAPDWHGGVVLTATPEGNDATGLVLHATPRGWAGAITVRSALGSGVSDAAVTKGTWTVLITGGVLTRLGGDAAIWECKLSHALTRPADDD